MEEWLERLSDNEWNQHKPYAEIFSKDKRLQYIPFDTGLYKGEHFFTLWEFENDPKKNHILLGVQYKDEKGVYMQPVIQEVPATCADDFLIYARVKNERLLELGLSKSFQTEPEVKRDFPLKNLEEKIESFRQAKGYTPDSYVEYLLKTTDAYQYNM